MQYRYKNRKIIQLASVSNCTGCGACASSCPRNCISMHADREGFLQPIIDLSQCVQCQKCESACPIIHKNERVSSFVTKAYAVINKNETIRMHSSSGGVFYEIAREVIECGGVVFGVRFDENWEVKHDYAETLDGLEPFMCSKYVQSRIGNTFRQAKQFLDQGREVFYTGTPCQIGGLYAFLNKDYPNLLTADLVCHGVPSPKVWQAYKDWAFSGNQLISINFRNKQHGWTRFKPTFVLKDKVIQQEMGENLYFKGFLSNIYLRRSCYSCKFKTIHREADITLADYWGVDKLDDRMFDDKGTSLVLIHSLKADQLFIEKSDRFIISPQNVDDVSKYNKAIIESYTDKNNRRTAFFFALSFGGFRFAKHYISHDSIIIRIIRKLHNYGFGR